MARGVSRLEGIREARETLQDLSRAVQRTVGKRALTRGGDVFVSRLKAAMPVSSDPSNPTKGSLAAAPEVVPARSERGSPRVAVLIEDPAAAPGEFGTRKMRPHLRVRATVDATRDAAGAELAAALVQEVDAAVQRIAKRKG